jgi:diaminopimelate decarboxylase
MIHRLALFPETVEVVTTARGERLAVAGCELDALADRHDTPLYIYDAHTVEAAVTAHRRALAAYPGESGITYAGKAFLCTALARWMAGCGLWLDCTGEGELHVAVEAGVPREQVLVHGVNKSDADLRAALAHAGTIVIDNLSELARLVALLKAAPQSPPALWLRFRPGVPVETHAHIQTGQADRKFGMSREEITTAAGICRDNGLPLTGLHFHLGSLFRDPAPVVEAIDRTLDLAQAIGLTDADWTLCPGGGLGAAYHEDDLPAPSVDTFVRRVAEHLAAGCQQRSLPLPRLQMEPGRSLIARAGVAIYKVGAVKETEQRRWLLVDGGMADNPRPALYGARYSALPVREPNRPAVGDFWVAGPYCESGDILIQDIALPAIQPGERLAIPVSGAYHLSLASNYNGACRPAALWLENGVPHLIQARETPGDLTRRDRPLAELSSRDT